MDNLTWNPTLDRISRVCVLLEESIGSMCDNEDDVYEDSLPGDADGLEGLFLFAYWLTSLGNIEHGSPNWKKVIYMYIFSK